MARDRHQPTPSVVRSFSEHDRNAHVVSTPYDGVTHSRGFGDSGYRVQVVEYTCPECSFDRSIRRVDVSPERQDGVSYWCLNPNCAHFVSDHLSHACHGSYPQGGKAEPEVYESPP